MAAITLTQYDDYYVSDLVPTGGETANAIYGVGGNDTIYGNGYVDFIYGGAGNDAIYGMANNDCLLGEAGNDTLDGGSGDDLLVGESGADILKGGTGVDTMYGGTDNDRYYYSKSEGSIDTINDDKSAAGNPGYGGGTADYFYFQDVQVADMRFYQSGNDLWVTDAADVADGFFDTGVVIEDFFLGGNNEIERVYGSNGYYDTSTWV